MKTETDKTLEKLRKEFDEFRVKVNRNRFVGDALRDTLPEIPARDELPTAGPEFLYRLVILRGTPDIVYICLRDAGGAYDWEVAATG